MGEGTRDLRECASSKQPQAEWAEESERFVMRSMFGRVFEQINLIQLEWLEMVQSIHFCPFFPTSTMIGLITLIHFNHHNHYSIYAISPH